MHGHLFDPAKFNRQMNHINFINGNYLPEESKAVVGYVDMSCSVEFHSKDRDVLQDIIKCMYLQESRMAGTYQKLPNVKP